MTDKTAPVGTCDHCGGPIAPDEWHTRRGPRRYCSRECRNTANSRNGNSVRVAKLHEAVAAGRWVNPREGMSDVEISALQSIASRKGRLREVAEGKYDETTSRASVNHSRAALLAPPTPQAPVTNIMSPKPMTVNSRGVTNRDLFGVGQPSSQPNWQPLLPATSGEVLPEHYESLPSDPNPVLIEPKWMARERKATAKSEVWASNQERIAELAHMIFARVRYYDPTTANVLRALGPSGPGRLITGTSDITAAMQLLATERGKGGWPLAAKRGEGQTSAWRWVNQNTGECEELGDKSPSPAATMRS